MNNFKHRTRRERIWEIIIGQTLMTLLIAVISLYLIYYAFGYKINWNNFSFRHTGMIYLSFSPSDADVYLDGKLIAHGSSFSDNFYAGFYDVEVNKFGYNSWTTSAKITDDMVFADKSITLFRSSAKISDVSDTGTIASIDSPNDSLISNPQGGLSANSYEIWNGENLVTRFSSPITGVIWYPGNNYIGYQKGDEIRIIERSGTNDQLLVKLSSANPTHFLFSWDGSDLLYKDGTSYKKASIN
ncbi:MAG: hypothetical protein NTW79_03945 [Candidatus Berkelbacteria bacterium]|nr:hypothetical protein [Candidatus Berkelbacteria bacterium]